MDVANEDLKGARTPKDKLVTAERGCTDLSKISVERRRLPINDAPGQIDLVFDKSGKHLLALEILPMTFDYRAVNYGYRLINIPGNIEEKLKSLGQEPIAKTLVFELIRSIIDCSRTGNTDLNSFPTIQTFHVSRNSVDGSVVKSALGEFIVTTEPLGTLKQWLDGCVPGSRTTVQRTQDGVVSGIMDIALQYTEASNLERRVTIKTKQGIFNPEVQLFKVEQEMPFHDFLSTTEQAIQIYINEGPDRANTYLSQSVFQQIYDTQETDVNDYDLNSELEELRPINRLDFITPSEACRSSLPEKKTPSLIRTTFLNQDNNHKFTTSDLEDTPFLAKYGTKNSRTGPISITLTSDNNSPGVFIGKRETFLDLIFFRSKVLQNCFMKLNSGNIPERIEALDKLRSNGFRIELARNSWDLKAISDIKSLIEKELIPLNRKIKWRLPCTENELLEATMNFLRGRQTLVLTNSNKADWAFDSMSLALDNQGDGTVKFQSRFGVSLLFNLPRFEIDNSIKQAEYVESLVTAFSKSPSLALESLFRQSNLIEEQAVWSPEKEAVWAQDPRSWHSMVNPIAAKTFHFVAAFYDYLSENHPTLKATPFLHLMYPYLTALPEKIDIKIKAQHGGKIEFKFSDKGLIGINLYRLNNGYSKFIAQDEIFKSFTLIPSDDYLLGRALSAIDKTLELYKSLNTQEVLEIEKQRIWSYLNKLQNRLVG